MLPRRKFLAMLPGFRFLFGAIIMCMSVLVFGLGATALMRAAHEDFASNPTWRAPPEPRFAQQDEPARTVLAVLSVPSPAATEPGATSPKATDTATAATPADTASASIPSAPETTAALTAPEGSPAESAPLGAPAAAAAADAPTSASESKVAATEPTPEPLLPPEQPSLLAMPESSQAATRIATLGGPAVITEETAAASASASNAKPDRGVIDKKLEAERAKERRRLAARRARLAQQAAAQLEATNPFMPHPLILPQASAH
jgi:hypothetical protein